MGEFSRENGRYSMGMPPAKTKPITTSDQSLPKNPKDQQQFAALLERLHEAVNSGNIGITMQAMPKLAELYEKFPKNVNVLVLLGRGYMAIRNIPKSVEFYRKAAAIMPMEPEVNFQYGIALENHSQLEQALDRFERVLQVQPDHFYALRHVSSALDALGRKEEAYDAYVKLVEKYEDAELDEHQLNALAISAAAFAPQFTDAKSSLETLETRIEMTRDRDLLRAGSIQLARLHKHLKNNDEAFTWYERGKAVDKDQWDCDAYSKGIDELIECWRDHTFPFSKAKNIDGSRLIFIVGMPRSGTSLTEQMLAQLKTIEPGGELNIISDQIPRTEKIILRHAARLPINPRLYTQTSLDAMSKDAMKAFNKINRRLKITDKQPYNYALVPLIAHMLPGAKFIHCTRDPLDCCLSNYSTAFTQLHMQTHDQYWLGRYYADYERVMRAWHELPEVEMMDLAYEDMVQDAETQTKRMTEFLGLEWDESILRFHESERTVITASRDQVRKKLYTSSVAKYVSFEHRMNEIKRGLEEGRARPHGG